MRANTVRLLSARLPGLPPDLELSATLYLPLVPDAAPAPGLIVGHGAGSRGSRHEAFCREACAKGFVVLALDFRGHGDSSGAADGPLEEDILAAARFLGAHPAVDPARLSYRGSSMGGFYGLKAAAQGDLAAVVLVCPASEAVMIDALESGAPETNVRSEATEDLPNVPDGDTQPVAVARWDVPRLRTYFEGQCSLELAARVHCPALLVHARGDSTVPFGHSLALAEHLGGDVTLLALSRGTHTSAQHDPAVHSFTVRWLLDQLTNACTART